jgi:hypothetical protein
MTALWLLLEKKDFLDMEFQIPDRTIDTGLRVSLPVAGQMVFCSPITFACDGKNHEALMQPALLAAATRSSNDHDECAYCCTDHCASADPDAVQI